MKVYKSQITALTHAAERSEKIANVFFERALFALSQNDFEGADSYRNKASLKIDRALNLRKEASELNVKYLLNK